MAVKLIDHRFAVVSLGAQSAAGTLCWLAWTVDSKATRGLETPECPFALFTTAEKAEAWARGHGPTEWAVVELSASVLCANVPRVLNSYQTPHTEDTMTEKLWSCYGPTRGQCGKKHETEGAALACCKRDALACQAKGKWSDRWPARLEDGLIWTAPNHVRFEEAAP